MRLRRSAHIVYKTQYNVVFSRKYRTKIRTKGVSAYLKVVLQEIWKFRSEVELIEVGVDRDHMHLHAVIPPKYAVGEVVRDVKANTVRRLKAKFGFLERVYRGTESIWSSGFFVSMVGVDEQTIRNYVRWQDDEDLGQAELEL